MEGRPSCRMCLPLFLQYETHAILEICSTSIYLMFRVPCLPHSSFPRIIISSKSFVTLGNRLPASLPLLSLLAPTLTCSMRASRSSGILFFGNHFLGKEDGSEAESGRCIFWGKKRREISIVCCFSLRRQTEIR